MTFAKTCALTGGLLAAAAWFLFAEPMRAMVAEGDLCWMVPTVFTLTEGKSLPEVFRLIVAPIPAKIDLPALKFYLYVVLKLFHGSAAQMVGTGIGLHLLNAFLLQGIVRRFDGSPRVGFLAAAVYGTLFVHFHPILWPTATAYHLSSLFSILLVLFFYLETERRWQEHRKWKGLIPVNALLWGAASLGRGSPIALLLVLVHLLTASRTPEERTARYDRWLPFFILFLFYPAYSFSAVREHHANTLLRFLVGWMASNTLSRVSVFGLLMAVGFAVLLGIRWFLRSSLASRFRPCWGWVLFLAVWLALAVVDHRQILLPYNGLAPFITLTATFLEPIQVALSSDTRQALYLIRPRTGPFPTTVSLLLIGIFVWTVLRRERAWWVWIAWYAVALVHFLFQFSSQPVTAPSRHFIYISPVFAVLFAVALDRLGTVLLNRFSLKPWPRNLSFVFGVLALCLPNLVAIRLATWRGRLTNNYFTYDAVRQATLIREDREGRPGSIALSGVVPMPFDASAWPFVPVDARRHQLLQYVFQELFPGAPVRVVSTSEADYRVEGTRLLDRQGREVDPFFRLLEEGERKVQQADYTAARQLLLQAVRRRPFFLRYALPARCRLEDVRWLTGSIGLRNWIRQMEEQFRPKQRGIEKERHVEELLDRELADYALSLATLAYVEYRLGDEEASWRWLSQLRLVEKDPELILDWIGGCLSEGPARDFLGRVKDSAHWVDPIPWRKDDYGFGRFLVRFLWGWDLPTRWERQYSSVSKSC